jgi:hypothetical protein
MEIDDVTLKKRFVLKFCVMFDSFLENGYSDRLKIEQILKTMTESLALIIDIEFLK